MTETDEARLAEARQIAELSPHECSACGGIYPNTDCGHLKNANYLAEIAPCAPLTDDFVTAIAAALAFRDVEIERLRAEQQLYEARVEAAIRQDRRDGIREGRRQMRDEAKTAISHAHLLLEAWNAVSALPDDPPTQEPE